MEATSSINATEPTSALIIPASTGILDVPELTLTAPVIVEISQNWWDILIATSPAIAALIVAWIAIDKWRREMRGKRELELAELVLADFYEARDIMAYVRNPFSYHGEGGIRAGADDELEDVRRWRDARNVPLVRLNNRSEFFAKMYARQYQVMALFGRAAAEPYDRFNRIKNEVINSAQMLMATEPRDMERDMDLVREWERNIGWGRPGEDVIRVQIDEIVEQVEKTFRPKIEAVIKPVLF